MSTKNDRIAAMNKAQALFAANTEKEASLRGELAAAKAANLAKIAKLKALRVTRDSEMKTADSVKPEEQAGAPQKTQRGRKKLVQTPP